MTRENDDRFVTAALNRIGMNVGSVFDLMKQKEPYLKAIPVLVDCLSHVHDKGIKEGIVRALTVREARGKADVCLVAEFRDVPVCREADIGLKWAIANALSVTATDVVFMDVVELVKDKRHGRSREMLAVALGNMNNIAAVDVLIELLNDDEVAGHALIALGNLKAKKARPNIERFLQHVQPWVRRAAHKALTMIDK